MNATPIQFEGGVKGLSRSANCKLRNVGILLFAFCNLQFLPQTAAAALQTDKASQEVTAPGRVIYEISRLKAFDDERLPIALMAAGAIALVGVVWYLYRRDAVELTRPARYGVMLLRFVALAGLFVFFLGVERRTTTEVIHNSQLAVLVDVSQSMGLGNTNEPPANGKGTRIDAVVDAFVGSPLIGDLRRTHDVNVVRFEEDVEAVVTIPKEGQGSRVEGRESTGSKIPALNSPPSTLNSLDWSAELQARGTQTRLGQALGDQLRQYRNAPLAGVVVISDGAQNAGVEPTAAIAAAKAAKVPLYAIGLGSTESPRNVALRDLVVPARAFPGDTLNVTGYLQADGYDGKTVEVELTRRKAEDPAGGGTPVASEQATLGKNGDVAQVSFDFEPGEAGTFVYQLRIKPPADDGNPRDNQREAEVEVVDRQTRVLLFASGPMRDYQYLRNQLFRDKTMTVDVLLQTAQAGISQESNELLAHFPSTAEELYKYDCIVAFDPDWTALDATQVELLEKWVSEEAGGLIVVAGPIKTTKWTRSTEHAKIRDLYPVTFQQRMTLLDDGHYGGETPWPLEMNRAGREAKFLWLGNSADESAAAWDSFPGVYGYYAVKGEKPGATVYARFSDPETGTSNDRPVYMAGQFYGGGQVFYIGSGELWRLRSVDPAYFEVLYTKLIRHVSQGRILRGSSRGSLLVERDRYELGETVVLRARLSDSQHEPLVEESVSAQLLRPDGETEAIKLTAEVDRPGMYMGQATVLQEGTYQVALSLPGASEEPLNKYIQVRVPDLERTRAERNEPLLSAIAKETGGVYYKTFDAAIRGDGAVKPLSEIIPSRAEVKLVKGAPDQEFAKAQMNWLLGVIAGSLFIEWIVRRLNRLA
jgi:hypothetical protein